MSGGASREVRRHSGNGDKRRFESYHRKRVKALSWRHKPYSLPTSSLLTDNRYMDVQDYINAMGDAMSRERSNYHATLGDLIEKLKNAPETGEITPKIVGICAYRGYYSDIALCTDSGNQAYVESYDYEEDSSKWEELKKTAVTIDFTGTPKQIAEKLESLIGRYFEGYKGGFYEITLDKPLWLAQDYGDCSRTAVIEITDDLKLITKIVD